MTCLFVHNGISVGECRSRAEWCGDGMSHRIISVCCAARWCCVASCRCGCRMRITEGGICISRCCLQMVGCRCMCSFHETWYNFLNLPGRKCGTYDFPLVSGGVFLRLSVPSPPNLTLLTHSTTPVLGLRVSAVGKSSAQ